MEHTVRHPEINVQLSGEDGNVFAIIGRVDGAMRRSGVPATEREEFRKEMFSAGSYDEALQITMRWVAFS